MNKHVVNEKKEKNLVSFLSFLSSDEDIPCYLICFVSLRSSRLGRVLIRIISRLFLGATTPCQREGARALFLVLG